jgi:hypothetical protein
VSSEDTQNNVIQAYAAVFYLQATCFGLDINSHQAKKVQPLKGKGKAVPLQAWSGPEGARKLGFPDYMTTAQDGGKVNLRHRPPLPQGNAPGTRFC